MEDKKLINKLNSERNALVKKTTSLFLALNKPEFHEKVGEFQHSLLKLQHNIMVSYVAVLGERIFNLKNKQ